MKSSDIISDSSELNISRIQNLHNILECNLCLSMVCEPISISCGHTFCRVCLVKALRRHKKQCPSCREICHVVAENAIENVMLKNIVISLDPESYQLRLEEALQEKQAWSALYPIFFLNNAIFPGSRLSLNLFEPRYRIMMKRIIDTTKAFAYVPNFNSYVAKKGDVALIAVIKTADFQADGRCGIDARITKRKCIIDHYVEDGTQGLHYCRVDDLDDDAIKEEDIDLVIGLKEKAVTLSNTFLENKNRASIENEYGTMPSLTNVEALSLWLTAISPLSEKEKHKQLNSKNTKERLQKCIASFEKYARNPNNNRQHNHDGFDFFNAMAQGGIANLTPAQMMIMMGAAGAGMASSTEEGGAGDFMQHMLATAMLGRRPRSDENDTNPSTRGNNRHQSHRTRAPNNPTTAATNSNAANSTTENGNTTNEMEDVPELVSDSDSDAIQDDEDEEQEYEFTHDDDDDEDEDDDDEDEDEDDYDDDDDDDEIPELRALREDSEDEMPALENDSDEDIPALVERRVSNDEEYAGVD